MTPTQGDARVESINQEATPEGERTTVVILDPTPAGDVHPTTPVVPVDTPDATPQPAGELAPDVVVVSPPENPAADPGPVAVSPPDVVVPEDGSATPPASDDVTPSGHPADVETTTAGESGNAIVIRPDDPDATPVPAGDLDPGTVVIPADTPRKERGPVTGAELARVLGVADQPDAAKYGDDFIAKLDAAGYRVVRK